jgi:uncharacterized protein YodC (DUF2158 family)
MTVESPNTADSSSVLCQWFNGKRLERGHFDPDTLDTVADDARAMP